MNIEKLYTLFLAQGQKITIDTRKIEKGQIFFALKGENFDGNLFAEEALKKGARYVIADDTRLVNKPNIFVVENVLKTLQQLALYHRRKLNIPIIAITGSNGKTTTKELIKEVLAQKFKVAYTKGNLNNHIGIPLTILDIKAYEDISIVEMGANHQGEIADYCTYSEPNFGLITNIGKAHLEGFGGIEGVIKGKTELYQYIRQSKGRIFLNFDDAVLSEKAVDIDSIPYGTSTKLPISGNIAESQTDFLNVSLEDNGNNYYVHTQLTGSYNLYNVLAAYAIGRYFEIPEENIIRAIEHYTPSNSRSQIIKKDTYTLILDAYNANPSSMELALKNLANFSGRRVAIIGAMKELGNYSEVEHDKVLQLTENLGIDEVIAVGVEYVTKMKYPKVIYFSNTEQVAKWYRAKMWNGETILLKGSRSMALEKIL